MTSTLVDRLAGVAEGLAVKAAVRAATTANITLSGEQTIDNVACVEGDRVLVKNQTDPTENGIWGVSTGNWERTDDFDGARDVIKGTRVYVNEGAAYPTGNALTEWYVSTSDPIVPGTTSIAFTLVGAGITTLTSDWAEKTDGPVNGIPGQYSAKEYAHGVQALTGGSSKNWAQQTGEDVTGAAANSRSAKSWAQDNLAGATFGGSSKDWAQNTAAPVDGATDFSAKEWAVGLQTLGLAGGGSSMDWATYTGGTVDDTSFSSKEYAQGVQASTGGSAKNWAQQTAADVTGAAANSRSAKSWAQDDLAGATLGGSAKDWAQSASQPDGVNKSAKSYAADSATSATNAASSAAGAAASAAAAAGLSNRYNWTANAASVATTASLPSYTYSNGTSGVGATITASANGAMSSSVTDGISTSVNDRVLILPAHVTDPKHAGLYVKTQSGDSTHPFIFTRATDADSASELSYIGVAVAGGSTLKGYRYVLNLATADITVGTTALNFVVFGVLAVDLQSVGNVLPTIPLLDGKMPWTRADWANGLFYHNGYCFNGGGDRLLGFQSWLAAISATYARTGEAGYETSTGLWAFAAANTPRINYDSVLGRYSYMREGAATCLALQNRDLRINLQLTVTGGSGTFTDGETVTATGGGSGLYRASQSSTTIFGLSGATGTFTGTLTGGTSGATKTISSSAAVWVATNMTVAQTTGADGVASAASRLTASAGNATILQAITGASAQRALAAIVKRVTGTGIVEMTQDGGSTWTDITSAINSSTFARVPASPGLVQTVTNPNFGFRIGTSGDAIDVDMVTIEAGAFRTSPQRTTTATAARGADNLKFPFTQRSGTVMASVKNVRHYSSATNDRIFAMDGGNASPLLVSAGSDTKVGSFNGTRTLSRDMVGGTWADYRRVASTGNSAGTSVTVNGLAPVSDSNAWAGGAAPTFAFIGENDTDGASQLKGDLFDLTFWNTGRVSDDTLRLVSDAGSDNTLWLVLLSDSIGGGQGCAHDMLYYLLQDRNNFGYDNLSIGGAGYRWGGGAGTGQFGPNSFLSQLFGAPAAKYAGKRSNTKFLIWSNMNDWVYGDDRYTILGSAQDLLFKLRMLGVPYSDIMMVTPCAGNPAAKTGYNTFRDGSVVPDINADQAAKGYKTARVDLDASIGVAGAETSTTYFQEAPTNGRHPTDAGQQKAKDVVKAAMAAAGW